MIIMPFLCETCERLIDFTLGENDEVIAHCEAYPDGIPEALIYSGHIYPKPNDNGLQFKGEIPDFWEQSQEEENEQYDSNKKFYNELNISDEKWLEMKHKEEDDDEIEIPDSVLLSLRARREDLPKMW